MSFFRRLSAWWNKNDLARAEEETRVPQGERDVAEEDYEARKDDVAVREYLAGGAADYDSDSEAPRP
jgi:hypothetical protein